MKRLPRWSVRLLDSSRLKAVRTTRFFVFEDDAEVRVAVHEGGAWAKIFNASRTVRSDLGQNPINPRELLNAPWLGAGNRTRCGSPPKTVP